MKILSGFLMLILGLSLTQSPSSSSFAYFLKNNTLIVLEIAKTKQELEKGLMYRKNLPKNHGMVFIFETAQILSFWMKNTLIPLDMIFLRQGQVVALLHNIAPCPKNLTLCPTYTPRVSADRVVELNAGMIKALDFNIGDRLTMIEDKTIL